MQIPPVLSDVLPIFPEWDSETLQHLELDLYELNKFAEFNSLFNNIVDPNAQVRTALHGWANQLTGCPCGCRKFPFHEQRLREKGLFGALVPMGGNLKTYLGLLPKVRHMHPYEMAVIHGAKPNRAWFPSLRLGIAGLGQMASHIQSCWITGQFLHHVSEGQSHMPEAFLWHHVQGVFQALASEHPNVASHPNVQEYLGRLHSALWYSSQASLGPARPIGVTSQESSNSHRKGRQNPLENQQHEQDLSKQPGTRPQEPEKKVKQPGHRTQEPDAEFQQPGTKTPELVEKDAEEARELHPPMNFHAKPTEALVPVGPSPHPDASDSRSAALLRDSKGTSPCTAIAVPGTPHSIRQAPHVPENAPCRNSCGGIDMSCKRSLSDRTLASGKVPGDEKAKTKQARTVCVEVEDGTAKALHAALFQKRTHPDTPPHVRAHAQVLPNSSEGGIPAFGTAQDHGAGDLGPLDPPGGEIPSQELLQAAVDVEGTPGVHPVHSSHTVQVFSENHEMPFSVLVDKEATVGSITVAEERIGSMHQPIAVYTCIGSPMKLSDPTSPCMQVFPPGLQCWPEGHPWSPTLVFQTGHTMS